HVEEEGASTFRHHHHLELSRGFNDLLTSITTRLVVALHAERTNSLHATQVTERVFIRRRNGLRSAFSAVENGARGVDTRSDTLTSLDELRHAEDHVRAVGRIVHGGDTEGQVHLERPVCARRNTARACANVCVNVNDA